MTNRVLPFDGGTQGRTERKVRNQLAHPPVGASLGEAKST